MYYLILIPSNSYPQIHRQAAILLREVSKFRHGLGKDSWPCIVAGGTQFIVSPRVQCLIERCPPESDFNFSPDDAAYSLLLGDPLLPEQSARLAASRVVHVTIDPDVPVTTKKMMADDEGGGEGEGEEKDPDRIIVNARAAKEDDGLLTDKELREVCESAERPFSAYDRGMREASGVDPELTFGSRKPVLEGRRGGSEPVWTSYTHVSSSKLHESWFEAY